MARTLERIQDGWRRYVAAELPTPGLGPAALALWIAAVACLWLEGAAVERRVGETRHAAAQQEVRREAAMHDELARFAQALQADPATLELAARRGGYGRRGESAYPVTPEELRAAERRLPMPADAAEPPGAFARAAGTTLLLLIAGVLLALFFNGLRLDTPPAPPLNESEDRA